MINDVIRIDLAPFGGEGAIELSRPTLRRKQLMKNALGKSMGATIDNDGRGTLSKDASLGDIELIKAMAYIKSAPFSADMESFLKYCDRLDDARLGAADELFSLIQEKITELEEAPGPLEG